MDRAPITAKPKTVEKSKEQAKRRYEDERVQGFDKVKLEFACFSYDQRQEAKSKKAKAANAQ